jgi:hypothetical protein
MPQIKKSGTTSSPKAGPYNIAALGIKAPWAKGRFFRAGGFWKYMEELAAVTMFPPVVGEFANRDCGWGPACWYYNQFGHDDNIDQYSIDFTSYRKGKASSQIISGSYVLAVADGVVKEVVEWVPSGVSTTNNKVIVDHYTDAEYLSALLIASTGAPLPRSRYSARYLHLEGPNLVPVSVGLYVEQGTVLGMMDNTGFTNYPHLHFSMHDNNSGFISVRPTPMDGQTLNDNDDGKCMYSTNVPIYYKPRFNFLHSHSNKYVCSGATNNGGNIHIWDPIPIGHEDRYKFEFIDAADGYHYIRHEYSDKYVCSGSTENGGNIHLWGPIPSGHEDRYKFKLVPIPKVYGYYYIVHKYSGKYVCSGATDNGGNIHLWGPIPTSHERRYAFYFKMAF